MSLTILLVQALITAEGANEVAPAVLESPACRAEFDRQRGTLLRLVDKAGPIDLKAPSGQTESFRLLVPLSGEPENYVYGRDQVASRIETSAKRLVFHWDRPMKDPRGRTYDLPANLTVESEDGSLVLRFRLANRTRNTVQEVWYPGIGGLLDFGPPGTRQGLTVGPPPQEKKLCRPFGRWIATYPGQKNMPFLEIENRAVGRSLYFGAHDPIARFKAFCLEEAGQGPESNVTARLVYFPFVPPGGDFEGPPVVAQFHDGDWIQGGRKIYRPWFEKTFGLMTPERDWIRRQGFFQMIMVMLPEGNVNYRFGQIPQLARDGVKYGLTSLQIAGWQRGGHDNGYPYYEPDPRLGTWAELQEAIRQCHGMGVKVYFFVNLHVNTLDTDWYRRELKDYDYLNANGYPYSIAGWGMGTLAARMGHTTPLMVWGDVSFPGLGDRLRVYFKELAEIGADGLHIDKCFPAAINFNPRAPLSPDQSPWEGTIRLVDAITRECRAVNPEFRISFETNWDRLLQYGDATWWSPNMAIGRRIFPELVETVGLYQPYDYAGLNDAVREGHAVMVAPHHFNRSMDCESWRGLAGYLRDVKKTRDALADYVFFGERLGPGEVRFQGALPGGIDSVAYRNLKNGRRACIVTNRGPATGEIALTAFGPAAKGRVEVYRPGGSRTAAELPAKIAISAERLVFIVEQ